MDIHLLAEGVDDVITVGDENDDVTFDDALGQIPPRSTAQLVPEICGVSNPAIRMVMMYHAALSHIDDLGLWHQPRVVFRVEVATGEWSVATE